LLAHRLAAVFDSPYSLCTPYNDLKYFVCFIYDDELYLIANIDCYQPISRHNGKRKWRKHYFLSVVRPFKNFQMFLA